jgi:HEAT repeat protein
LTELISESNPYTKMIQFTPLCDRPDRASAVRLLRRFRRNGTTQHAHLDPLDAVFDLFCNVPSAREVLLAEIGAWSEEDVETLFDHVSRLEVAESIDFAAEILSRRGIGGLESWIDTRRQRPEGARWLVEVLTDLADLSSVRVLIAFLDHPDLSVRRRASDALCGLRSRVDGRSLVRHVTQPLVRRIAHPDPLEAVRVLHRLADAALEPDFGRDTARRSERVLQNCVIHEKRPAVRGDAIAALGEIGSRSAVRCLVDMLHREDAQWHREVVIALRKIRPERALIALLGLLQSHDPIIREEAANALGEIGDRQAVRRLRALLDDEDEDVRQEAVLALGKLGGSEVLDALERALSDGSAEVRIVACSALADTLGDRAQAKLIRALYDHSPDVRAEAAYLLGSIGDATAEAHLELCVEDDERDGFGDRVGAVARRALRRIWAARHYGRSLASE